MPSSATPSPELGAAIAAAVASAPAWPRPIPPPELLPVPAKPEVRLGHAVCAGPINREKERPRRAACCYPGQEAIRRPLRAAYADLRVCYEARKKRDAEGRVVFDFRIAQDGTIPRVCASEASNVDDEDAVRCMVEVLRKVRYPAMSNEERDLCGLIKLTYPVIFEP
jgi:hypothetical protein